MGGKRFTLAVLAYAASALCFVESLLGLFVSYGAYKQGLIRGVPFHTWASTTLILMAAAGVLCFAGFKLWPERHR